MRSSVRGVLEFALVGGIAVGFAAPAWGIGQGRGAAPAADNNRTFIGKVQFEDTPLTGANPSSHTCTGSVIRSGEGAAGRSGVALTAAHCVNMANVFGPNSQRFERFYVQGHQYAALGVRHADYPGTVALDGDDIALMLLLNGQAVSAGNATLASNADNAALANGQNVEIVGFSNGEQTSGVNPLKGTSQLRMGAAAGRNGVDNPKSLIYDRTLNAGGGYPGSNWMEKGDSGGPTFRSFDGVEKIIGVHSGGDEPDAQTIVRVDIDTRVFPFTDFIAGKGNTNLAASRGVLNYLAGAAGGDWNANASWNRTLVGGVAAATIPRDNDIVVMDPAIGTDSGTTVAIGAGGTRSIEGLLTDVTLNINGGALSVTGGTGALNGGVINIGGNAGSAGNFSYSLDNEGTVNVTANGTLTLGNGAVSAAAGARRNETSLYNGQAAILDINGGTLNNHRTLQNRGNVTVRNNSTATIGTGLDESEPLNANVRTQISSIINETGGVLTVDNGTVEARTKVQNAGTLTVRGGGTAHFGSNLATSFPAIALGNIQTISLTNDTGGTVTVNAATLRTRTQMTNLGNFTVTGNNGEARIGENLPDTYASLLGNTDQTISLLNSTDSTTTVDGATLTARTMVLNEGGTINVRGANGVANFGGNLAAMVQPANMPPIALDNSGNARVTVESGGTLNVLNGANDTAIFRQSGTAQITVQGGPGGAGTANIANTSNGGFFTVDSGGVLNNRRSFTNLRDSTLAIQGGANGAGTANTGAFVNTAAGGGQGGGLVVVFAGGVMNASRPAALGAGLALDNQAGATIGVRAGGRLNTRGRSNNAGNLYISSNDTDGVGLTVALDDGAGNKGLFSNAAAGVIEFNNAGGSNPQLAVDNTDFRNEGTIRGRGSFVVTADSNFDNRATAAGSPNLNMNQIGITWDSAFTAAVAAVTMETTSIDNGAAPAGLTQPFALDRMCLTGASIVRLVNMFNNEGNNVAEVIYVRNFGISATSRLDLNGLKLYYLNADSSCGGIAMGSVTPNGGQLIQIPEPGTIALLAMGVLMAGRRRRMSDSRLRIAD